MSESGWREQDFTIQRAAKFSQSPGTAIKDRQSLRDDLRTAMEAFERSGTVTSCPPVTFTCKDQIAAMNKAKSEKIAERNTLEFRAKERESARSE